MLAWHVPWKILHYKDLIIFIFVWGTKRHSSGTHILWIKQKTVRAIKRKAEGRKAKFVCYTLASFPISSNPFLDIHSPLFRSPSQTSTSEIVFMPPPTPLFCLLFLYCTYPLPDLVISCMLDLLYWLPRPLQESKPHESRDIIFSTSNLQCPHMVGRRKYLLNEYLG